jgi:hypothetical protein
MSGSNGLTGIAQLANILIPSILGSGTTTKNSGPVTTTSTGNADSTNSLMSIIQQALANSTDGGKTAALVNSLFTQAGQNFLPTLGSATSSGMYDSPTLGLLADNARGQAVNQAAGTVLNYQSGQQSIAGSAATNLGNLNNTKVSTSGPSTSQTSSIIPSPISAALGLGIAGKALMANKGDILKLFGMDGSGATAAGAGAIGSVPSVAAAAAAPAVSAATDVSALGAGTNAVNAISDPTAGLLSGGLDVGSLLSTAADTSSSWAQPVVNSALAYDPTAAASNLLTGPLDTGWSTPAFDSTSLAPAAGDLFSSIGDIFSNIFSFF